MQGQCPVPVCILPRVNTKMTRKSSSSFLIDNVIITVPIFHSPRLLNAPDCLHCNCPPGRPPFFSFSYKSNIFRPLYILYKHLAFYTFPPFWWRRMGHAWKCHATFWSLLNSSTFTSPWIRRDCCDLWPPWNFNFQLNPLWMFCALIKRKRENKCHLTWLSVVLSPYHPPTGQLYSINTTNPAVRSPVFRTFVTGKNGQNSRKHPRPS